MHPDSNHVQKLPRSRIRRGAGLLRRPLVTAPSSTDAPEDCGVGVRPSALVQHLQLGDGADETRSTLR